MFSVEFLSSFYSDVQPVVPRSHRTYIVRIVGTEWVVRPVEIQLVDPGLILRDLQLSAGAIGLASRSPVVERNKERLLSNVRMLGLENSKLILLVVH